MTSASQASRRPADTRVFAGATDINTLVNRGSAAETNLAEAPPYLRSRWLRDTAEAVRAASAELARLITREGIKTIRESRGEVARAAGTLEIAAEEALRIGGETLAFDRTAAGANRSGWTTQRPVGLVAAITPFNDPLNLVAHKVGPAIAAGCPVILKPHEQTPGPARRLRELFLENGLPEYAFQVLDDTSAAAGDELVRHPAVRMLSFTGGRAVGTHIGAAAEGRPLSLELGGVCASIVLADADPETTPGRLASGMFAAAGQNCLHVQRVLVAAPQYERLLEQLTNLAEAIRTGDPMDENTDMGPMIDEAAISRCEAFVRDAVQRGGRIVTGGKRIAHGFEPTILADAPADARIVREEVFGPITVIERIDSIDDAVTRLGDAGASLATAVFTRSLAPPFALRRLRTGCIMVNDSTDFRTDDMPFGGPFPAGRSREGVRHAMADMLETQVICLNFN